MCCREFRNKAEKEARLEGKEAKSKERLGVYAQSRTRGARISSSL